MVRRLFVTVLLILIIYFTWAYFGRGVSHSYKYKPIAVAHEFNKPGNHGNIVAIQSHMTTWDYVGAEAFLQKLDYYLEAAQMQGWINQKTIVVFPEHIGTWLVASGEKEFVYTSQTIDEASRKVIMSNLLPYAQTYYRSEETDRERAALFKMKAPAMLRAYQYAFSKLAKKYEVAIIAGSIVLPEPVVEDGKIVLTKGPLKNVTATFNPDGSANALLFYKRYLGPLEREFMLSAQERPVMLSAVGNIGVLTCTDSWYSEIYEELAEVNTRIVVVPACAIGNDRWSSIWDNKNGAGARTRKGIGTELDEGLTYEEAWHRNSFEQAIDFGISNAIAVFLRGELWDLDSQGQTFAMVNGELLIPEHTEPGGGVFNMWLP